ncbi:MAG: hypothetical protein R6U51_11675 [Anaerolineales bacterium]
MVDPDILIYLDVSYQVSNQRTGTKLKISIFKKQRERLQHAKKHADVIINTDHLQPEQVLKEVLDLLRNLYKE